VSAGTDGGRRGQSLTEFALVLPLFLLVIMGSIDFAGYFASRLSVENAARAAVRWAVTQCDPHSSTCTNPNAVWTNAQPPGAGTIEQVAISNSNDAKIINQDCPTNLATLTPGTGCITISYYDLNTGSLACPSGPGSCTSTLCAQWSASSDTLTFQGTYTSSTCLVPNRTLVQVLVGYNYKTLTPLPLPTSGWSGLTTSAGSQLLEEQ
jgi:Flp pilus assembly protein TadG